MTRARVRTDERGGKVARRDALPQRLLLDTHVWLWWQMDDARLGTTTRKVVAQAANVYLSVASAWEIAIKSALGKLELPLDADIARELERSGFLTLPVLLPHTESLRRLPNLHRDPFDRMLVAQARTEGLTFVTADRALEAYEVALFDATQ